MAGAREVWLEGNYTNYGYNPYNRVDPATFILRVSGVSSLVTNLPMLADGSYVGVSDSVSLFAGHIASTGEPDITTWLPLQAGDINETRVRRDELRTSFAESIKTLKERYGLAVDDLAGKRIIQISDILSSANNFTDFAVFDDYILVAENVFYPEKFLYYYIDKEERAKSYLYRFLWSLYR